MRLFTVVRFPENVIESFSEIIRLGREAFPDARFVTPENLHLTLVFIGETEKEAQARYALEKAGERYRRENGKPVTICFNSLGTFRSKGGDIFWAGIRNDASLSELQSLLLKELADVGYSVDRRAFKPHITLARKLKASKEKIDEFESRIILPDSFEADTASLVLSHRRDGILCYDDIAKTLLT